MYRNLPQSIFYRLFLLALFVNVACNPEDKEQHDDTQSDTKDDAEISADEDVSDNIPSDDTSDEDEDEEVMPPATCETDCVVFLQNHSAEQLLRDDNTYHIGSGELVRVETQDVFRETIIDALDDENIDTFENTTGELFFRAPYVQAAKEITIVADFPSSQEIIFRIYPITTEHLSGDTQNNPPAGEHPGGREYGAMWFSKTNPDDVYMFGGFDYTERRPQDTLWRFSLSDNSWNPVTITGEIGPSANTSVVSISDTVIYLPIGFTYAPNGNQSVGYGFANIVTQVDRDEFVSELAINDHSQSRYQAAAWYEPASETIGSLCGMYINAGSPIRSCDLAEYALNDKSEKLVTTLDPPVGRDGFAWGKNDEDNSIIIFSGDTQEDGGFAPTLPEEHIIRYDIDTKSFSEIDINSNAHGRRNPGYFYDSRNNRLFIFGGTPDGENSEQNFWVLHDDPGAEKMFHITSLVDLPPFRASAISAYSKTQNTAVLGFGNTRFAIYTDMWRFNFSPQI